MRFDALINQIIEGDCVQDYINLLAEATVRLDDEGWIALIAHYLDLWELHGHRNVPTRLRPLRRTKPTSIGGKQPVSVVDPETGEPTPEGFAEWRGIDPDLFMRMFERYKNKAEAYRRTQQHKHVLGRILKPDIKDYIRRFSRVGRVRDPKKSFEHVRIVADYLNAKSVDSSLRADDYAKSIGISPAMLSVILRKYRAEAESYRYLKAKDAPIPSPSPTYKVSKKAREQYKENKLEHYKKYLPDLDRQITVGLSVGRTLSNIISYFAREHMLDSKLLDKMWNDYSEEKTRRSRITQATTLPAPIVKPDKPDLFRGMGGYRTKRKSVDDIQPWIDIADAVEQGGLTDHLVLEYADLVGVRVIKKVKKFPTSWNDSDIIKWMKQNASDYIRLAKPKLEAELKKKGLWNPPAKPSIPTLRSIPRETPSEPIVGDKKSILIVGGVGNRALKAHPWIKQNFNVHYIDAGRTAGREGAVIPQIKSAASSGKWDLVIVMSAFTGHDVAEAAPQAVPYGTPIISRHNQRAIRSIHQAAQGLKAMGTAEWFVSKYEEEKGVISDSMDWVVYNLLETIGLEMLVA